jgi:glutaredoxin
VKIEFLYWDGCPSSPEAKELLAQVLEARDIEAQVEMREVRTEEEAESLGFPGSPTIRIDGRDVDPAGSNGRPALNCRIYYLPDGRVSPVPTREQLEAALP